MHNKDLPPITALAAGLSSTHISTGDEYQRAIRLIDALVDDYHNNEGMISTLAASIERWEDHAEEFACFNAEVAALAGKNL